jgi:type I restriction-modification system DNA methylase subunit
MVVASLHRAKALVLISAQVSPSIIDTDCGEASTSGKFVPLDKQRLGQLIDMIGNIRVGDEQARAQARLGRVYAYFLAQFASAEGKKGGEFYMPRCVVKLLVEMLEPDRGRVYDRCCGSAGMFVQPVAFIRAHASDSGNGGRAKADISDLRPGVELHHLAACEDEPWIHG